MPTIVKSNIQPNLLKRPADPLKLSHGGKERKNVVKISVFDYFVMKQNQVSIFDDPFPHGRFELVEQNLKTGKVTFTFFHGSLKLEVR